MTTTRASAPPVAAEFVHRLFVLLKAAAVYGPDNDGFRTHAEEAREPLRAALEESRAIRLETSEDNLYFNSAPIRLSPGDAGGRFLVAELRRLGAGGLSFEGGRAVSELAGFATAFHKAGATRECGFDDLVRQLRAAGLRAITALPRGMEEDAAEEAPPDSGDAADAARRAFHEAVAVVEELMSGVREGREPDLGRAKTVVSGLAERVAADPQALFELAVLERFDKYTYAHCVNVSIYSVAVGVRLGLSRESLAELGFGALFHDAGKARLPRELIDKPDEFDEDDWRLMRLHPALGAKALLAMRRPLDSALARAVSIAFEHHLGRDGSGYPKLSRPRRQELFSRICAVADAFDAMTSGRVYAKKAMSPDEAVRRMVQRAGTAFDPLMLRLFIGAAGVYPIGSALRLDSGESCVVLRNDPREPLRPKVVVFAGASGAPVAPKIADLAGGADLASRVVERTLDPAKEGFDAREVLRRAPRP